ncbi:MAG: AMMECR1 domain-containing protein [Bryobacteraceae bacterium]
MSPLRRVMDIQEIHIGQHGLLIHALGHEGLLLPQVASKENWDRATFLQETCHKAGLPGRAWQDAGADLFRFTALVFNENKPVAALAPLDLFANPRSWPSPPAPGSPAPTATPF